MSALADAGHAGLRNIHCGGADRALQHASSQRSRLLRAAAGRMAHPDRAHHVGRCGPGVKPACQQPLYQERMRSKMEASSSLDL